MEIKLDKYTLRFDPSEIRISIDGEKIDVGARTKEEPRGHCYPVLESDKKILYNKDIAQKFLPKEILQQIGKNYTIDTSKNTIKELKPEDDLIQIGLDQGIFTLEQVEELITARGLRSGRNSNAK